MTEEQEVRRIDLRSRWSGENALGLANGLFLRRHTPFAKTVFGVLIFIGLWSRLAYCAGFLLIITLTFGSTLRQDWTAAGWQLLYAFA